MVETPENVSADETEQRGRESVVGYRAKPTLACAVACCANASARARAQKGAHNSRGLGRHMWPCLAWSLVGKAPW